MPTEDRENPTQRAHRGLRTIAPLPAGLQRTPEWHAARAALLRWLGDPEARYLAKQHAILAKLIEHPRRQSFSPP
jgi:hypothetical protein